MLLKESYFFNFFQTILKQSLVVKEVVYMYETKQSVLFRCLDQNIHWLSSNLHAGQSVHKLYIFMFTSVPQTKVIITVRV